MKYFMLKFAISGKDGILVEVAGHVTHKDLFQNWMFHYKPSDHGTRLFALIHYE